MDGMWTPHVTTLVQSTVKNLEIVGFAQIEFS